LMTYETVILHSADMEALDNDLIKRYFYQLNVISERPSDILLEAMGLIGRKSDGEEYHPTIGGVLLFGTNPAVYLPHSYIKVSYYEEVRLFYGNILKMLDNAYTYIEEKLMAECRMSEMCYPVSAVSEAIANALVHRDYLDNSRGILVSINDKNIEISNLGALLSGNSIYKYIKENNPDRRNSWLYQRLLVLDEKRRFMKSGLGMQRIREAFRDIGEVKFLNIGSQNLFKVILPRVKQ
jgi:ATP-dependent DNA helicase RecG